MSGRGPAGFQRVVARAVPLPLANVDTDQLIPARFMTRSRRQGYGDVLLHDLRFDEAGDPQAAFPLNDPRFAGAQVLIARRNFGSGSSREAAVYALADFGIRVVIAPSFGDIFAANAVNNGLVPAQVSEAEAETLLAAAQGGEATIDLEAGTIALGNHIIPFQIDPVWRMKLLNGWDDLDLTLSHQPAIRSWRAENDAARPWTRPRGL